jgi:hypothetical protein
MSDAYLSAILQREAVDVSITSPVRQAASVLIPMIQCWAGKWLNEVSPSGSFAKGTANRSGTDIDLFISLHFQTPDPLKQVHDTLVEALKAAGYQPRRQNVSIGVKSGRSRAGQTAEPSHDGTQPLPPPGRHLDED